MVGATVAGTLLACGDALPSDPVTGLFPAQGSHPTVVVGPLEWTDVTSVGAATDIRERTRAVGFLAMPGVERWCTAALVAPAAVITAADCVTEREALRGATVSFRRETGIPEASWRSFACDRRLAIDPELGFAVVGCEGRPGDTFGVAELVGDRHLAADTDVYLVQQACNYVDDDGCEPTKRLSEGTVLRTPQLGFDHDADALEGALGGPLFARRGHGLVGVHQGGSADGRTNRGVEATAIRQRLEALLPELELGAQRSAFGGPPLPPDPFEPNQDAERATPVQDGFASDDAWIDVDDLDVYAIELEQGSQLRLTLKFDHQLGDIDVAVYAGELHGLKAASGVSASDDESVRLRIDVTQTYYIVVFGYQGAVNAYHIRVGVI